MLEDSDLARLAQQGDRSAFEALVQSYEELAFRAAYLIVRDEDDAADAAQDAFVRAYQALDTFDTKRAFRPWLLRIVTNVALNSTRAAKRRQAATERLATDRELELGQLQPDVAAEVAEQAERVWEAIGGLSDDDQNLIYLRYFLESSEAEAAAAIGKPVGTVKSRLHRALRRLRQVIEDHYPDLQPVREERHESTAKS
ncbi:MAG: sigma-70 family RNA polymerase sigma factor [Chloroflexi bacterium]|nr:sigma-70 family RNA polymerase sigma factor [Chloroflexota bacterium]MCI0855068.1 sigma-70 family RNA polymerase sigma factor [Chloroflexota bacterium]MCI0889712.1 sigma-70 family RNA polymerase sigma factor [Chloroflexota bacterium]